MKNLSGIILAGGKSKRLGLNKLGIKIGPIPLFMDQIYKLSFFCNEILIVTSKENRPILDLEINKISKYKKYYNSDNFFPGILRIIEDMPLQGKDSNKDRLSNHEMPNDGTGPLLGIYTGLTGASNYYSIVLACDMPFLSYRFLELLALFSEEKNEINSILGQKDAYIFKTKKGMEALGSLYSKKCAEAIKSNISMGLFKISDSFDSFNTYFLNEDFCRINDIDMLNFFNINSREEYEIFIQTWQNNNINEDFLLSWKKLFYR